MYLGNHSLISLCCTCYVSGMPDSLITIAFCRSAVGVTCYMEMFVDNITQALSIISLLITGSLEIKDCMPEDLVEI